ncbi:hypothetical protein [Legionella rowbothamii]|uniref:hypothetical protein n=1 Tax=Legionella rowbothamii TaxID=96229 RepID=UPI0010564191|nr:hypothetical protein [Legionella rowbothamii]
MEDYLSLGEFPTFLEHYYPEDYLTSIRLFCFFLEQNYGYEFEERFDTETLLSENPQIVSELLSEQDAFLLLNKIELFIGADKCQLVASRYTPNSYRVLIDYDLLAYHANLKNIREYINSHQSTNKPRYCIFQRASSESQEQTKVPSLRVIILKRLAQNGFISLSPEEYDELLDRINELDNFYIVTEIELLAELSDALKNRRITWQRIIKEWQFTIPVLLQLAEKQVDLQETLLKELGDNTFVQLVAQCNSKSVFIQFIKQAFHSDECRDHLLIDLNKYPHRYVNIAQGHPPILLELIELALTNEEVATLLQSSILSTEEPPAENYSPNEESFKREMYKLLTMNLFGAPFGEGNINPWSVLIGNARFNPIERKFLEHMLCHPVQLAGTEYYDSVYYQNGLLALLTESGYHESLSTLFELATRHRELHISLVQALLVTNTTKNVLHELSVHAPDYLSAFLALAQSSPALQDALAIILDTEKSYYLPAIAEMHEENNEVQSDDNMSWDSYCSYASPNYYGTVMDLARGRVYSGTRSNGGYEALPSLSLLAKAEPQQLFKLIKMTDTSLKMRSVFTEIIASPAWKEITANLSEQAKLSLHQLAMQSSQTGYSSSFFNNTGINIIWNLITETMKEQSFESAPSSSLN